MITRLAALLTVFATSFVFAESASPQRFRDFKIYATSTPDLKDDSHIVVTLQLVNAGKTPLRVSGRLSGKVFEKTRVEAGKEAAWTYDFAAPEDFKQDTLSGDITFGDDAEPDRELFVALRGPDPADFKDTRVEKITAKAQVVGAFSPRTRAAIEKLVRKSLPATDEMFPLPQSIVFDPKGMPKDLIDAVADLGHCIDVKTGAHPTTAPSSSPATGRAIQLRIVSARPDLPHLDAYHLRAGKEGVVIEATTPDGLRHGIYGLLTDHLGCHWFMPKKLGEEIEVSPDRTAKFPAVDETRVPSFFSSSGMSWHSAPRWDAQNRSVINRGRMVFGHAWAGFIDKAKYPFDKFPDMWSRDRSGKVQTFDDNDYSATNFCSTNPDVIRIVAEKINAQFDASPDAIVASLDPNDYSPMCQCDRCLALDKSFGVKPTDDKQMSDRLMKFSQEIYDRLKPEHKGKFLGILAYGYQTRPPKSASPHAHHATIVCDFPGYADHSRPFDDPTSPYNRDFLGIVKGWGAKVKQLGYYDYYGHYNFFGPWGILHKMREDLPAFRELGGTFVCIESQPNFAMHGLNLFVASRLVWDVDADVDVLVEEYLTKFFGPAADPMRDFYRAAERQYALTRPGIETAVRVGADPKFWDELDGCLKRAELPNLEKKFADRVQFTRDGFTFGKRYFELGRHAKDAVWLRETKAMFDAMKTKYSSESDYWPTMLGSYFYPDVDAMLKSVKP